MTSYADIYIPLCFYFIDKSHLRPYPRFQIYIPLCFYFIIDGIGYKTEQTKFTFHYASTLSRLVDYRHFLLSRFTFHYASTLSLMGREYRPQNLYLHSTMLLLYQRSSVENIDRSWIYIPLCFYFIGRKPHQKHNRASFTFHYASTLSNNRNPYI